MGAWGTGLYSDDFALDIKSELIDAMKFGKEYREAFDEVKEIYLDDLEEDDPDIPTFWFVCADVLWKLGRLDEDIKQTALAYINNGGDVERWMEESTSLGKKRKAVLEKLKKKILSPQPERKPIKPYRFYTCPWNTGDIFAMPLQGEEAMERGLVGNYLMFQVVDKRLSCTTSNKTVGDVIPIVRAQLSFSKDLPTVNDFTKEQIIQVRRECIATDWKKVYAFELAISSQREIPKSLTFLGNRELIIPDDDFGIQYDEIGLINNSISCTFRYLEYKCINYYFIINLKES